jgi:hypothetical protein
MDFINKYPDKPWEWHYLSHNPNLTIDFIKKNPDIDDNKWNWYFISENPNISMSDIESNPDQKWRWGSISKNPSITIEFIEKNIDKVYWETISHNTFEYQNELLKNDKIDRLLKFTKLHTDLISMILKK